MPTTRRGTMSTGHLHSRLILGDSLGEGPVPAWLGAAYGEFRRNVTDPGYPCYFGTRAELAGHLYYTYADHVACAQLPASILKFLELKRASPHFDTNLAIFLAPETQACSHDDYRARLWHLLQHLHDHDPVAWPATFASEPGDVLWEFAFGGEQFFVFCASPSYHRRRSRNLGDCQVLMLQPRSSFTVVERSANGAAARARVRERIARWDDIGAHPDLGTFGDPASREWKQYFLPDDMTMTTGRCPFRHRGLDKDESADAPTTTQTGTHR